MSPSPTPPSPGPNGRLTEVELELMSIIWRLGEGTVNDVLAGLPADRPLAYTSVSTILRILEKKGVLVARKRGRGHVYVPAFGKADYEAFVVQDLVTRVFEGTPAALVSRLLEAEDLSAKDLDAIRALLSSKRRGR